MTQPSPTFEAPWHADVFALTVALHDNGTFDWPEWTHIFGSVLAQQGCDQELDGGDDYFTAWVIALEEMLSRKGLADSEILSSLKTAWTQAYLDTPHGQPVQIKRADA